MGRHTSRINRNVLLTLANTLFSGALLYFLYQYLLGSIGIKEIGIWSVVTATTAFGNVGGMGLAGSVLKFVAKYEALDRKEAVGAVVQTAGVTIAVVIASILLIAYIPLDRLLGGLVPEDSVEVARAILPFAMLILWISSLSSVFQSALEGLHRFDVPAVTNILMGTVYLGLVLLWVPQYGLHGLLLAQLAQAGGMMLILWLTLRHLAGMSSWLPLGWSKSYFREMLRYGINFQVGSLLQLLLEPVTKLLMSRFGGLSMVGYFDMANRMVMQFRAILVSANRVLIPVIAEYQEIDRARLKTIYVQSFRLLVFLSIPLYVGVASLAPSISRIWIGRPEPLFIQFAVLLSFGWLVNTLVGPSYMGNLGAGTLRWNTAYHAINGLLNLIFGIVLGWLMGGTGVAIAFVLSIAIASILLMMRYQSNNGISVRELRLREHVPLVIVAVMGMFLSWWVFYFSNRMLGKFSLLLLCMAIVTGFLLMAVRRHPVMALVHSRMRPGVQR